MVKPDLRHNYYADLELPTTASIDEIHKAYRKLALQYHPDRNNGREDECVPKFQAIQAANEVLGDPINKQKYDSDRRKLGGAFGGVNTASRTPTPGNPYAANSPFPPPPRRTQPATYQQQPPRGRPNPPPQPYASNGPTPTSAGPPPSSAGTGADRFAGFPRPSDRKDPAQDRANVFKAWQNMQNTGTPDRQQRQSQPNMQPPRPEPTSRARPGPPPPRPDGRPPAEEPSRGGMKYKTAPPYDPEGADKRQSAWAAFQQNNAGKPGMPPPDSTWKDPRKGAFNPRPSTADRPDDFARSRPNVKVVPPQGGGRPADVSPETPLSPKTQRSRPGPEPLRQSHMRVPDDQVPFAEANRISTPYTKSFVGERTNSFGDTAASAEGLRRSHSTRDTSKLAPESRTGKTRARSSSPQRASREGTPQEGDRRKGFDLPDDGDGFESDAGVTHTPEEMDDSASHDHHHHHHRTGSAPNPKSPYLRPKDRPDSKNRHFDGTASGPTSPPSAGPGMSNLNGATAAGRSDNGPHEMRQSGRGNMYADPSPSSPLSSSSPSSQPWTSQMFGSSSTPRAKRASSSDSQGAVSSRLNSLSRCETPRDYHTQRPSKDSFVTAADERFMNATKQEQTAYLRFQNQIEKSYDYVPDNLDMEVFLLLVAMSRKGQKSGDAMLDHIVADVLSDFESVNNESSSNSADARQFAHSFDYTPEPDQYADLHAPARSDTNINTYINTTFSPDGWKGEFVGEPDYFAPPAGTRRKKPSPSRRPAYNRTTTPRSSTMDEQPSAQYEDMPQRPYGSDGTPSGFQRTTPAGSGFDRDGWEKEIQDSQWAWPPSPGKTWAGSRKQSQSRKTGKTSAKAKGTRQDPHVVDDEEGVDERSDGRALDDDVDPMDIDDTPPSHHHTSHTHGNDTESGARHYSVPPSDWQRQQETKHRSHRKSSTASASKRSARSRPRNSGAQLNANLDDLRDSLAQTSSAPEALNLNDMSASLPFQSQPSGTMYGDPSLPRDLLVPPVPKPPSEPQKLSKMSWHAYAASFAEYVKAFHTYNATLLRHFESREQQAQAQIGSGGVGWLEATGDTSGRLTAPTGFGTYLRGVKEDERVREAWGIAWERHAEAVKGFERVKDRVRRLVVGGMLVEG